MTLNGALPGRKPATLARVAICLRRSPTALSMRSAGMRTRSWRTRPPGVSIWTSIDLNLTYCGVRKEGLEPPSLAALEPKSSAFTNSATFAARKKRREVYQPGRDATAHFHDNQPDTPPGELRCAPRIRPR